MTFTVSHMGIVVADLERSARFYCDGLGFARGSASQSGNEIRVLSEFTEDVDAHWQFVRKDGLSIELMQYLGPRPIQSLGRRPLNQIGGPSHIALRVDDMDAALRTITEFGGQALHHTRTRFPLFPDEDIELCYCLDPDEVRLSISRLGPKGIAVVG
jgi:catechol 2,3-dioxygenase-like lactoylglutathione lyase family enzyme